jgi:general stress protein 26
MSIVDPAAFWRLLAGMPVCMLVTHDGPTLRSRPMAPSVDAAKEEVRFLTRRSSHKVDEIDDMGEINLAFMDARGEDYVSVSGMALLSQDRDLMRAIWTDDDDISFPEGPDGPDVAAIRVLPTMAEYWDARGGERRYAWLSFRHTRGRAA